MSARVLVSNLCARRCTRGFHTRPAAAAARAFAAAAAAAVPHATHATATTSTSTTTAAATSALPHRSSTAIVFPGQGSQRIGAGLDLLTDFPYTRHVFDEVDDALQMRLSHVLFRGTDTDLRQTEVAQPAILAHSMATWAVLKNELGVASASELCAVMFGHSLGEYSALCAADALSLADAARLVRKRGLFMRDAMPPQAGAMAALLPCPLHVAQQLCEQASRDTGETCALANVNTSTQMVVSGSRQAVEACVTLAKAGAVAGTKVRRAVFLDVSAPFHSPYMQPARTALEAVLATTTLRAPTVPIISNVTSERVSDPASHRSLLGQHVTQPVRWMQNVQAALMSGCTRYLELGPSSPLVPMIRSIAQEAQPAPIPAECSSLCTSQDLRTWLRALSSPAAA